VPNTMSVLQVVSPALAQMAYLQTLKLHGCHSLHGGLDLSLSAALTTAVLDGPSQLLVTGLSSSCNLATCNKEVSQSTSGDSDGSDISEQDLLGSDCSDDPSCSSWETCTSSQYQVGSAESGVSSSPAGLGMDTSPACGDITTGSADLDDDSSWGSWETYDGLGYSGRSSGSGSCTSSAGVGPDTSPADRDTDISPAVLGTLTSPADPEQAASSEEN
jgi:hypothetical protein